MDPKAQAAYQASAQQSSEIEQVSLLITCLEKRLDLQSLPILLSAIDSILGSLYAIYLSELDFLADDDPQNKAANTIASAFSSIRPVLGHITQQLEHSELDDALENAYRLRAAINALFRSFDDIKQQSQQAPSFSKLPFTHELIRVIEHYLNKKLPLSAVQKRLETFSDYHDSLESALKQLIPTAAEAAVFIRHQSAIEEAMALQLQGVEELDLALEQQDSDEIRAACSTLQSAADLLYATYQDFQEAESAPSVLKSACIYCGAETMDDPRQCSRCGARIPKFDATISHFKVDIKEGDNLDGRKVPEELVTLKNAAAQTLSTENPAFIETALSAFAERLKIAQKRLVALQDPPKGLPQEQSEVLSQSRAVFYEALQSLKEGHDLLQDGAKALDAELIGCGLDEIETGFNSLEKFSALFSRAQAISAN